MRRAERAMTLLEVMAAVALLGILYTVLAKAAAQGIRSEGDSRRRMEASLLADSTLAEIETRIATGEPLDLASTETENEGYRVSVLVAPFELPPELEGGLAGTDPAAPSAFGSAESGTPGVLQRVDVRVAWKDGIFLRSTERVTFVFDTQRAQALMGGIETPATGVAP